MKDVRPTYEELLFENENLKKLLSEKTRIETSLRDSEDKWKSICLNSPSMLILLDLEGVILFINRADLDFKTEDVIGTNYIQYVPQKSRPLLRATLKKVIKTGKTERNIVAYNTKENKTHYFDVSINPIFIDGKVSSLITSSFDITSQKKAENELAEIQEKINNLLVEKDFILENSPLGISKIVDRKLVWVNNEIEKMLGYSKAELTGQTTRFLYTSDEAFDKFVTEAYKDISTGLTYITEQELVCKNGEHKIIRYIGRAVYKLDISKGSIWIIEDITKQKLADEVLNERKARFRELLENSLDVSYKRNLQTESYEYISPVFEKILGYTLDEFKSLPFEVILDKIHPEDRPEVERVKAGSLASVDETSFQVDYRFKHKNGHYLWVHNQFIIVRNSMGNPSARIGSVSDISERKKAEQALQHSKKQYEDLFELSDTSLFIMDYEGKYLKINQKAANQIGLLKSEIIGKSVFEILPADLAHKYFEHTRLMIDLGWHGEYEETLLLQGELKTFLIVDQCLKNEEGQNYALLSSALDITRRKQAEELLARSEEKLRHLIETMQIGMLLQGPNAEVLLSNSKALELLGLTESQLLGKTPFDPDWNIIHEDGSPFLSDTLPVPHALVTHIPIHDVVMGVYRPINGDRIWLLVDAEPQLDEKGNVLQVVCLFVDITNCKHAEIELIKSKRELEKVQKITKIGGWYLDLVTQEVIWTKEIYEIFDYDQTIALPLFNDCQKLYSPASWELLSISIAAIMETGIPFEIELESIRKDGNKCWMWTWGEVVRDSEGKIFALRGVVQNITTHKIAELIIKEQNLQLKKINSQKDKFFSIIAHDLRGPISVFLGFTDHMVFHLDTMTLKDIQKIAESMRNSATNLFRMLENLLDWSRVEQGLMPFNPTKVFLLPILNDTLSLARGLANNKGIEFTYKIAEDLEVFADWNMLKTVVRNFLSNAIKFTPKGGDIILYAEISGYKCINICIKDNGIGMNSNMVDSLFQLDASTGRKGTEGELSTGLGLILCKEFIETHGGRIWVESEVGKGSSFYFTLPVKDDGI